MSIKKLEAQFFNHSFNSLSGWFFLSKQRTTLMQRFF